MAGNRGRMSRGKRRERLEIYSSFRLSHYSAADKKDHTRHVKVISTADRLRQTPLGLLRPFVVVFERLQNGSAVNVHPLPVVLPVVLHIALIPVVYTSIDIISHV